MVTVQCSCGFRMEAEVAHLGQDGRCAGCGRTFLLWPAETADSGKPNATWFVRVGATEFGPFAPNELIRFAAEGKIRKDSLVRRGSTGPWTPAERLKGLYAPAAKASPPPLVRRAIPIAARAAPETTSPAPSRLRERATQRPAPKDWAASLARQPGVVLAMLGGLCVIGVLVVLLARKGSSGGPPKTVAAIPSTSAAAHAKSASSAGPAAPPAESASAEVPAAPPEGSASAPVPAASKPLTPQELVARAAPAVAVLQGRDGKGSGFLFETGILATNRHVVADELIDQVRAIWPDGGKHYEGTYGVRLIYEDPDLDVAILGVDVALKPLVLADNDAYVRGQEIMCIGSPGVGGGQTLNNAIGRGLLGTTTTIGGQTYHQLDLAVNPGNSGGPVFSMEGKVIGVVTLKSARLDGVGFCLPVAAIRKCMDRSKNLSTPDREWMIAQHRLRVCAAALIKSARCYAVAGGLYVEAMEASVTTKEDINVGLLKARLAVHVLLRRINGYLTFVVREHCEKPARDFALRPGTRERYADLLSVYGAIKEHVESPSGTLDSYKKEQESLASRLHSLEAHFVTQEGVAAVED